MNDPLHEGQEGNLIDLTALSIQELTDLDADNPVLWQSMNRVLQDVMSGDGAVAGFQSAL
jgi:FXSXX-COOH protein